MATSKTALTLALGSAIAASLATAPASANENPFAAQSMEKGYMVAEVVPEAGKAVEAKCGAKNKEGKCGTKAKAKSKEGKCGGKKSATDAEANKKMMQEGKCGEGMCGGKNAKEGKCGGKN